MLLLYGNITENKTILKVIKNSGIKIKAELSNSYEEVIENQEKYSGIFMDTKYLLENEKKREEFIEEPFFGVRSKLEKIPKIVAGMSHWIADETLRSLIQHGFFACYATPLNTIKFLDISSWVNLKYGKAKDCQQPKWKITNYFRFYYNSNSFFNLY